MSLGWEQRLPVHGRPSPGQALHTKWLEHPNTLTKGPQHPLCLSLPQVFLPGPAMPLNLPTVLITVQQKKSELRKDQSVDVLSHWGFTLESSFLRSSFLSSITQERDDQSEGEGSALQDRSHPGTSRPPALWPHQHQNLAPRTLLFCVCVVRSCPSACREPRAEALEGRSGLSSARGAVQPESFRNCLSLPVCSLSKGRTNFCSVSRGVLVN